MKYNEMEKRFIEALELAGIGFAITEWILHDANSYDMQDILDLISQELPYQKKYEYKFKKALN